MMRRIHRMHSSAAFVLAAAALMLTVVGCSEEPDAKQTAEEPLRVVTYRVEPFFYQDEEGAFVGYEYEVLKSFAAHLGRPLEVRLADEFQGVLGGLAAGEADIAAATLTVTTQRMESFDFASPHFPTLVVLVERSGEESDGIEDLRGKRIATIRGSLFEEVVRELPGVEVVYDVNSQGLFEMVDEGLADALVADSAFYLWKVGDFPELTLSFGLSEPSFYAFALRKGDPLKAELDAHLRELKRNGELKNLLIQAFGEWGPQTVAEMSEGFFEVEE